MIAHLVDLLPVIVLFKRSNGHMANGRLKLNEWVCLIMIMSRQSFAVGTEVCIVTDSAFESVAMDVQLAASAGTQRAVAIDTMVNLSTSAKVGDGFI
jgi:hypothetical protein